MVSALFCVALWGLAGSVETRQDILTLEPGTVLERPLARGEEHRYHVALTPGDYVSVIVEQRGIDVVVEARDPADRPIADFQEEITSHGQEEAAVVADAGGTYTLSIKPAAGIIAPGAYAIRVASRRAATDADRSIQESRTLRSAAARSEAAGSFNRRTRACSSGR